MCFLVFVGIWFTGQLYFLGLQQGSELIWFFTSAGETDAFCNYILLLSLPSKFWAKPFPFLVKGVNSTVTPLLD